MRLGATGSMNTAVIIPAYSLATLKMSVEFCQIVVVFIFSWISLFHGAHYVSDGIGFGKF